MSFKRQLLGFVNCMQSYTCLGAIRMGKPELDLMPERDTFYEICSRFKPGQLEVFVNRMKEGCAEVNTYFTEVKKMYVDRKYEKRLCLLNAAIAKAKTDKMEVGIEPFVACLGYCYRIYANITGKTLTEIDPQKNLTVDDCNFIADIRPDDIQKWNEFAQEQMAEMLRVCAASVEFKQVEEWYKPQEHPRNLGWIIYMSTRANDESVLDDMFFTEENYKPEIDRSGEYEYAWNLYKSQYSSVTRSFFYYMKLVDEYIEFLNNSVKKLPDMETQQPAAETQ